MTTRRLTHFLSTMLLVGVTMSWAVGADDEGDWKPLFNGKNLDGWVQHNGTAKYGVEDGTIVGRTTEGSPNSFLCTVKDYANFELKFEVLVDDELNSGVQIRSRSIPERDNGRVHGPQVEIATDGTAAQVYGEALDTGWLAENHDPKAMGAFKKGQWNAYRLKADGKHIQTWLNGIPIVDFTDDKSGMATGFIGLQVHAIARGAGPYQVRWRNIVIRELSGSE